MEENKLNEATWKNKNLSINCHKRCLLYGSSPSGQPYLHSGFGQVGAHGQPLSHHHVRVVGLLESLLQRLQLLRREGRAAPTLFAVLRAVASLQDDVLKCAAVERENTRQVLFYWTRGIKKLIFMNVCTT